MLIESLTKHWWMLLLRGVVAILFGILAFAKPGITLSSLVYAFGIFVLLDGIFSIGSLFGSHHENENWWLLLLEGLFGITLGVLTFISPGITAIALLFYIAIWAIATGVSRIGLAIHLRREIQGEWMLILSGIISIGFGIFMIARPAIGAVALLWYIAVWAVLEGALLIFLSLRLHSLGNRVAHA